ncbi:MAG: hypothetical protein HN341_07215 [Verrucomicrobia bacterium]|nr:hypothetical protein [Verrucomicrobiota bacterium]
MRIALKLTFSVALFMGVLSVVEGVLRGFGFTPHPTCRQYIYRYPDEGGPMRGLLPPLSAEENGPMRVLCLGDSFTYGMGVAEKETFPGRLRALLGPGVEVINAGMLGSGPFSQRKCFRDLLACRPKVVILGALINDAVDAEREAAERRKHGPRHGEPTRFSRGVGWLRDHTALQPFLYTLHQRMKGMPYPFDHRDVTWEQLRKQKFDHYNATLERGTWETLVFPAWLEIEKECRQRGISFMIVVFPVDVQLWESNAGAPQICAIQKRIAEFAADEQISSCDLTPAFRKATQSGELRLMYGEAETLRLQSRLFTESPPALFLNDGHPSPFGYAIAAEKVHAHLAEHALLR